MSHQPRPQNCHWLSVGNLDCRPRRAYCVDTMNLFLLRRKWNPCLNLVKLWGSRQACETVFSKWADDSKRVVGQWIRLQLGPWDDSLTPSLVARLVGRESDGSFCCWLSPQKSRWFKFGGHVVRDVAMTDGMVTDVDVGFLSWSFLSFVTWLLALAFHG